MADRLTKRLATKVTKRQRADAAVKAAQEEMYEAMLDAFEAGEMTYRQIAAATGLGRERVAQVLRMMREKRAGLESVAS
jgi:hypothetical protein